MGRTNTSSHSQKSYFLISMQDVKLMDDLKRTTTKTIIKKKKSVQEIINKINDTITMLKNELTELEKIL